MSSSSFRFLASPAMPQFVMLLHATAFRGAAMGWRVNFRFLHLWARASLDDRCCCCCFAGWPLIKSPVLQQEQHRCRGRLLYLFRARRTELEYLSRRSLFLRCTFSLARCSVSRSLCVRRLRSRGHWGRLPGAGHRATA